MRQDEGTAEQKFEVLVPCARGPVDRARRRFNERKITPFKDLRDRFRDSSADETISRDMIIAAKRAVGIGSVSGLKADYVHRITARANLLDAISLTLDSIESDSLVEKVRLMKLALYKVSLAQDHGALTKAQIGKQEEYKEATEFMKEAIHSRLQSLSAQLARETFGNPAQPLSADQLQGLHDFERGINSPASERFFTDKVREKRIAFGVYSFRTAAAAVVTSAAFYFGAAFLDLRETLYGIGSIMGFLLLHQSKKLYDEFIKMHAAEKAREDNFGIAKNDLEARKDAYLDYNRVLARTEEGHEITAGHILSILDVVKDRKLRKKRSFDAVMNVIRGI